MKIGPARYTRAGDVEFAVYGNDQTAIIIIREGGERECVATVNLEGLGAPEPGPDQVWIKTWSENEGIDAALVSSGVVTLSGTSFSVNNWGSIALLANLTPAAIAERLTQRAKA